MKSAVEAAQPRVLNINVGVLGHVDSGKTSLVAALSTKLSTAALDKHPQSKERGITLDLGFSSYTVPIPAALSSLPYDEIQFTLVDCPGHASLIRTIIGGAQIIDMMVLVIDITKGLQTQTAECLVVGEIATSNLIVALNKCDLIPEAERAKTVKKAQKRLAQTFALTKFAGALMVPVTAKPGGGTTGCTTGAAAGAEGVEALKATILSMVPSALRGPPSGPFLFSVDHCFQIKGQGTVMTGTVLQGKVKVGETVELPTLKVSKVVKSMQMFKRPVSQAVQGDRVGICVTQLDSSLLERGLACTPGSVPTFKAAVARVEKIRFYAGQVPSKSKFHVSVGHTTVMASLTFFGLPDGTGVSSEEALVQMIEALSRMAVSSSPMAFDKIQEYVYQESLYGMEGRPLQQGLLSSSSQPASESAGLEEGAPGGEDAWREGMEGVYSEEGPKHHGPQWALLTFEQPVTAPQDSLVIGAKFDSDINGETCRLAFYGRLISLVDPDKPEELQAIKLYKSKEKKGVIERLLPDQSMAIVRGMFKKETDPSVYVGLRVVTGLGEEGRIESSFGKSGKLKVHFPAGLQVEGRSGSDNQVVLRCKRYIHDVGRKKLRQ